MSMYVWGTSGVVREAVRRSCVPCLVRPVTTSSHKLTATESVAAEVNYQKAVKSVYDIPGPVSLPVLGSLPGFLFTKMYHKQNDIVKMFLHFNKQYGPVVRIESPFNINPNMVMVTRPDDCELLFRATMDNPIREGLNSLKKIRTDAIDNYFEGKTGILIENNEEWWRVRSRVQTPMMKMKNIAPFISAMDEVTLNFTDRMASFQEKYGEMPSDFQTELYKWALESVSLVALNRRLGCLSPDLPADSEPIKMINLVNDLFFLLNKVELEDQLWTIFPSNHFKELEAKHHQFLKLADNYFCETENSLKDLEPDDERDMTLIETLLMTPGLSRKDVVTLILDMLFAGIDTTSHTMGFTLYLLAKNPQVQAKLQEEVDRVVGDHTGSLTPHHLAQLSYLKAVIKESMRVFPLVTGVARSLSSDMVFSGYLIPKGWSVFAFTMAMGWDESLYPRAKEFLPERWMRNKPLGSIHPFSYLPFGAGTRMCVGRRIAEQEMFIFITRVMQRFKVEYEYEEMDIVSRLVNTPSQPLKFKLTERH